MYTSFIFANNIGNPRIGYSWREPGTFHLYHLLRPHDGDEKERKHPHTVQSDTTRCGVSRVGHVAKRPRLYRSDTDFTFTGSNLSRLPLDNNNVAIVKKRKKLNKERKERFGGRVVLENDLTQK